MVTLAATDFGDYLFLVIMLVFGLINWVTNKLKEGKAKPPPTVARTPRPTDTAPHTRTSEEERMRRFLEALGVPSDDAERPAPQPVPQPVPLPPPIAPRTAPAASRTAPPPLPREQPSRDEADTTDEPAEHIRLPELQTATVREFETVSSRASADADGDFVTVSSAISAVPACPRHPETAPATLPEHRTSASALLEKLRSRTDVRTALILSEILRPPRSLRA
jgi:hypothetical protein